MTSNIEEITNDELKQSISRRFDNLADQLTRQQRQLYSLQDSVSELNRMIYSTQQQLRDINNRLDHLNREQIRGTGESTRLGYPYPYK